MGLRLKLCALDEDVRGSIPGRIGPILATTFSILVPSCKQAACCILFLPFVFVVFVLLCKRSFSIESFTFVRVRSFVIIINDNYVFVQLIFI